MLKLNHGRFGAANCEILCSCQMSGVETASLSPIVVGDEIQARGGGTIGLISLDYKHLRVLNDLSPAKLAPRASSAAFAWPSSLKLKPDISTPTVFDSEE